jgi:hypothetical protein
MTKHRSQFQFNSSGEFEMKMCKNACICLAASMCFSSVRLSHITCQEPLNRFSRKWIVVSVISIETLLLRLKSSNRGRYTKTYMCFCPHVELNSPTVRAQHVSNKRRREKRIVRFVLIILLSHVFCFPGNETKVTISQDFMHIFPKFFILRLMELPDRVAAGMQKSLNGRRHRSVVFKF